MAAQLPRTRTPRTIDRLLQADVKQTEERPAHRAAVARKLVGDHRVHGVGVCLDDIELVVAGLGYGAAIVA